MEGLRCGRLLHAYNNCVYINGAVMVPNSQLGCSQQSLFCYMFTAHCFQKAIYSHTEKVSHEKAVPDHFKKIYVLYISNVIQVSSQLHLDDLSGSKISHSGKPKHLPMPVDASLLQ